MQMTKQFMFVANLGSSSIKYSLFEYGVILRAIVSGTLKETGESNASSENSTEQFLSITPKYSTQKAPNGKVANIALGMQLISRWLEQFAAHHQLIAIGHRITHGGQRYINPQPINIEMLADLQDLSFLDPEHLPHQIEFAKILGAQFPQLVQIACFDTAFHQSMPKVAQYLSIPRRYFDMGVKRYGFHGLSCEYLIKTLGEIAGSEAARGKVIVAHLGSGASITAIHEGRTVDTSMGLTPSSGIPMSRRSGDLDPGVALQMAHLEKMDAQQFQQLVNNDAGLHGISELSGNISELLTVENNHSNAAEAITFFCYHARKTICALAATMGGIDTLIFSGGIGENLPQIRARICTNLEFLGIELDSDSNDQNHLVISTNRSRVTLRVIKTDEEITIAHHIADFLEQQKGGSL
jgi:acetate kinase